MIDNTDFEPDYAVPPGETLLAYLDDRDMTQTDLAKRLDVSLKHVRQIAKGAAGISPDLAVRLGRVLGPSATFWAALDAKYQADKARIADEEELENWTGWANEFPVKELQSRGYIAKGLTGPKLVQGLLSFLAISHPDQHEPLPVPFRKSAKVPSNPDALTAWVRAGRIQANKQKCAEFDPDVFRDALLDIRALTFLDAEEWAPQLVERCADAGVAVVFVPTFKHARANGAAHWASPSKAIIQLSRRYVWEDIFWFSFFHEAGHILLHRKKEIFVDDGGSRNEEQEDEANRFAARMIVPTKYERRLGALRVDQVEAFAQQIGIAPGCVIGRMQHDGLPYNVGNGLRKKLPTWLGENA